MSSPISARIEPLLRQKLARYCVEHGISRTEAIERGIRLLLDQPRSAELRSPAEALEELKRLSHQIRIDFDPEEAEAEGRGSRRTRSMPFVLDNSVLTGWWTLSRSTEYTTAVLEAARLAPPHAPPLLILEFANVLRPARRHGNIDDAKLHAVLTAIAALKIVVEAPSTEPGRIISLSLQYGLTAYDAAYLELALRLGLPIACKDGESRGCLRRRRFPDVNPRVSSAPLRPPLPMCS